MPAVTGNVLTWGFQPFPAEERLLVRFRPSSAGATGSALLPLREEIDEPAADGSLTVNLAQTTSLLVDAWFTIIFEWFRQHPVTGEWTLSGWSQMPGELRVPAAGGNIVDLLKLKPRPGSILYGYGPPPSSLSGVTYYDLTGPNIRAYGPNGALI